MRKTVRLKIATPAALVFDEPVEQVTAPTKEGEVTILPHHVPLITALGAGDITAHVEGQPIPFAVVGGFMEVSDNQIVILADFAELIEHLTDDEIEAAQKRAEELKAQKETASKEDFEHFETELDRSLTRAKIGKKWRKLPYRKISQNK